MPRREIQGDRDRLAPEIGGRRSGPRIAPPGIADELLAGKGQASKRLHTARVVGERSEVPSLCLGCELRRVTTPERGRSFGQTLCDSDIHARCDEGSAARGLEEQDVKLARNPSGDPGLNRSQVFRLEFVPTRPRYSDVAASV